MKTREGKEFVTLLRDHGLHVTYQRLAIYRALCSENERHPSAEIIHERIKRQFPMISLGTVYKTLDRFHESGLIRKIGHLCDVARYDPKLSDHYHLVCLTCQGIQDIEDPSALENIPVPENSGFQVTRRQIFVHGYCRSCTAER